MKAFSELVQFLDGSGPGRIIIGSVELLLFIGLYALCDAC